MPAAWITGGLALAGGLLGNASSRENAARAGDSNIRAAEIAAEASKFKPIGTTTRFGSSNFGYDSGGNLTSAGYTMSPELRAQQDLLISRAGGSLDTAGANKGAGQGLFNLGQKYTATSPEEAAATWLQKQNDLLRPGNEQTYAALQQHLQNTGRGGLSVAQGGDLAAANPEAAAYYNSLARQQALLASQATTEGRNAVNFGAGLMGTGLDIQSGAYNPYKTEFGLANTLESAAQAPLDISASLAGRTTTANQFGATGLMGANTSAINRNYAANIENPWATGAVSLANNPQFVSGVSNWLNPPRQQGPISMPGYEVNYFDGTYQGR